MVWVPMVHTKACAKCGERIGQGERALRVDIVGVARSRFYCEVCGGPMVKAALPPDPPAAEVAEAQEPLDDVTPAADAAAITRPTGPRWTTRADDFDAVGAMAERFRKRPQSKERLA